MHWHMLKKIYKVINNLHGSVHHQKCHFLRVCLLKWDLWFQFSKYLQEPLSTWRTYNLFRVVNLGGWGRRKLWWGSYQKGARPNPFASDDDDVEDVAFVDRGPQDQTSSISFTILMWVKGPSFLVPAMQICVVWWSNGWIERCWKIFEYLTREENKQSRKENRGRYWG